MVVVMAVPTLLLNLLSQLLSDTDLFRNKDEIYQKTRFVMKRVFIIKAILDPAIDMPASEGLT